MTRYFGCHVSVSGGFEQAIVNGKALGVNTIQVHPSPPQRWNNNPYPAGYEKSFLAAQAGSGVEKIFFHGIYLINLAHPEAQPFHMSKLSLVHYLDLMERIGGAGGAGVIFHTGTAKHSTDEDAALARAAEGVNWIFENAPGTSRLILEVAAGAGSVIGDRLEELQRVYELVTNKERLGFGLDSQHLWASGYDLQGQLEEFVANVEKAFGLDKVWSVHLNDSKTECGSKKDRHENLGSGLIGREALTNFVRHPKLQEIPIILETPGLKEMDTAKIEVAALRAMVDG